jgi:hypothetical protein
MLGFHLRERGTLKGGKKGQQGIVRLESANRGSSWYKSFRAPVLSSQDLLGNRYLSFVFRAMIALRLGKSF